MRLKRDGLTNNVIAVLLLILKPLYSNSAINELISPLYHNYAVTIFHRDSITMLPLYSVSAYKHLNLNL